LRRILFDLDDLLRKNATGKKEDKNC
jgi:hypothetical protein